ncbi:hypothetical protein [Rhizobium sp. KDH_Rht_773_N]
MKATARKKKPRKDTSFATWKFQLENTVNGDPLTDGPCLQVLRAYLDFMTAPDSRPYLSILHLKVSTSLHEGAIIRARRTLVKLGYMVAEGNTSNGAVRYQIINARFNIVLDHQTITRETLLRLEAEKKERERARRLRSAKTAGHLSPAKIAGLNAFQVCGNRRDRSADIAGNYVYDTVESSSMEREDISSVERTSPFITLKAASGLSSNPYFAHRGDDGSSTPLPVPECDEEAESTIRSICDGRHVSEASRARLLALLNSGVLSPRIASNIVNPKERAA